MPSSSPLVNTQYFTNLTAEINSVPDCARLTVLAENALAALAAQQTSIMSQMVDLAPIEALLQAPTSPTQVVQWVEAYITDMIAPEYGAYLKYVQQLAALQAAAVGVGAAIENASAKLTSCGITVPDLTAYPTSPFEGEQFFDTTSGAFMTFDGVAWAPSPAVAPLVYGDDYTMQEIYDTANAALSLAESLTANASTDLAAAVGNAVGDALGSLTGGFASVQTQVNEIEDRANAIYYAATQNINSGLALVNGVYTQVQNAAANAQQAVTDAEQIAQAALANALESANSVAAGVGNSTLIYVDQANGYAVAAQGSAVASESANTSSWIAAGEAAFSSDSAGIANAGAAASYVLAASAALNANTYATSAFQSSISAGDYASNAEQQAFIATGAAGNAVTAAANSEFYSNSSAASYTLAASSAAAASKSEGLAANAASNSSQFAATSGEYSNTAVAASETANTAAAAALTNQELTAQAVLQANSIVANGTIQTNQAIVANTNAQEAAVTASQQAALATTAKEGSQSAANSSIESAAISVSNATASANSAEAAQAALLAAQSNAVGAAGSATAALASEQSAATSATESAANATVSEGWAANAGTQAGLALGYQEAAFTSQQNAAGSATTATEMSGVAASAAGVANSTVAASMPTGFAQQGTFWSYNYTSNPLPQAVAGSTVTYPTVAGNGVVFQTTTAVNLVSQGSIPLVQGHSYQTTGSLRIAAGGQSGLNCYFGFGCYDASQNYINFYGVDIVTLVDTTWKAPPGTIIAASSFTTNATFANTAYIRPMVLLNWTFGPAYSTAPTAAQMGYIQLSSMTLSDVTQVVAAQTQATAAATSATAAAASSTSAGQFATTATTQAQTATTQSGTATAQAQASAASATTALGYSQKAASSASLSASSSVGSLNAESTFVSYISGSTGVPPKWADWSGGATGTSASSIFGGGNSYRVVAPASDQGIAQSIYLVPGYFVMEAALWLEAGTLQGAGMYTDNGQVLDFTTDPDSSGTIGAGGPGIRQFSKLLNNTGNFGTVNVYLMNNWDGFGHGFTAKTTDWYKCIIRPATDLEVQAKQALANGGQANLSALFNQAQTAYETPLAAVTTDVTKLQSQVLALPNMVPNGGMANGFAGYILQQGTDGYYANPNWGQLGYVVTTFNGAASLIQSPSFPVSAGAGYTVSGNIQNSISSGSYGTNQMALQLYWYDANNNLLSGSGANWGTYGLGSPSNPNYILANQIAPANTVSARVAVIFNGVSPSSGASTYCYFQRIKCEWSPTYTGWSDDASVNLLAATVTTQAGTIATALAQSSYYFVETGSSGGNALVELTSSSTGGTAIQLSADKIYMGPNMYFTPSNQTMTIDNGTTKTVTGCDFGTATTGAGLKYWNGPSSVATSSCSDTNCYSSTDAFGNQVIRGSSGSGSMSVTNNLISILDASGITRVQLGLF